MKQFFLTILAISVSKSYSQTDQQLNFTSKELLQQGKYVEALPILQKAAECGVAEAQYNLGYFYHHGLDGNKNPPNAFKWYKAASDNNFNDGHYALMMAYGNGEGVAQDSKEALKYALKCANNNDSTCMWNVVNCYISGNGVEQNIPKFKEWIIRLAKLRNPENLTQSGYITSARLEIAKFYRDGKYFEQDLYQSYLWFIIYNEFKVDFSILKQTESIAEIIALEKLLSNEQKKNAKSGAEKLLGRELQQFSELYKTSI